MDRPLSAASVVQVQALAGNGAVAKLLTGAPSTRVADLASPVRLSVQRDYVPIEAGYEPTHAQAEWRSTGQVHLRTVAGMLRMTEIAGRLVTRTPPRPILGRVLMEAVARFIEDVQRSDYRERFDGFSYSTASTLIPMAGVAASSAAARIGRSCRRPSTPILAHVWRHDILPILTAESFLRTARGEATEQDRSEAAAVDRAGTVTAMAGAALIAVPVVVGAAVEAAPAVAAAALAEGELLAWMGQRAFVWILQNPAHAPLLAEIAASTTLDIVQAGGPTNWIQQVATPAGAAQLVMTIATAAPLRGGGRSYVTVRADVLDRSPRRLRVRVIGSSAASGPAIRGTAAGTPRTRTGAFQDPGALGGAVATRGERAPAPESPQGSRNRPYAASSQPGRSPPVTAAPSPPRRGRTSGLPSFMDPRTMVGWSPGTAMATHDPIAANRLYDQMITSRPTLEVRTFQNSVTAEYIIVQGSRDRVGFITQRYLRQISQSSSRGRWVTRAHHHPIDPATGVARVEERVPSGADLEVTRGDALNTRQSITQMVTYETPSGRQSTSFGYDLDAPRVPGGRKHFWVDYRDERGRVERVRFRTVDEYRLFFERLYGFIPN